MSGGDGACRGAGSLRHRLGLQFRDVAREKSGVARPRSVGATPRRDSLTLNRGYQVWPDSPAQPLAGQGLAHRPRLLTETPTPRHPSPRSHLSGLSSRSE